MMETYAQESNRLKAEFEVAALKLDLVRLQADLAQLQERHRKLVEAGKKWMKAQDAVGHAWSPGNAVQEMEDAESTLRALLNEEGTVHKTMRRIRFADGQPCDHPGCQQHVTHLCEGCGRLGAKGVVYTEESEQ